MTLYKFREFYISQCVGNLELSDPLCVKILRRNFPEVTKDKYEDVVCGPKIDCGLSSCSKATFWKHGGRGYRTTKKLRAQMPGIIY
jgi:hypothetical protein